ncbi:hypothetical protein [Corynebacterium caspium]|uniref:hypothetical protein n=1 Tax=Corynebacterium caspium TaxID=234828 RepID=UPI0003603FD3|nr:hypothetical protein [Corynebacterium caspium]WKD59172.1 hypothetical protein CCASP_03875 [Corynebacterium caspium DSM 44850]
MTTGLIILLIVVLVSAISWAYFTAQRLNRLHIRTDAALARLSAVLDRRDAVIIAVLPDLAPIAKPALALGLDQKTIDKRAKLTRAVDSALDKYQGEIPVTVMEASALVELASRFYNEAVTDTRALRTRYLVQLLKLGGTARLPRYFEGIPPILSD